MLGTASNFIDAADIPLVRRQRSLDRPGGLNLLSGMVREAIKVADEKKVPALEALLSALGIMSWKAGDRRAD
jgi:hypothetical protein